MGIKHQSFGPIRYIKDVFTTSTQRSCCFCKRLFNFNQLANHLLTCDKRVEFIPITSVIECVYCNQIFAKCNLLHHVFKCALREKILYLNFEQSLFECVLYIFKIDTFANISKKNIAIDEELIKALVWCYSMIKYLKHSKRLPVFQTRMPTVTTYLYDLFRNYCDMLYNEEHIIFPHKDVCKKLFYGLDEEYKEELINNRITVIQPFWTKELPLINSPIYERDGIFENEFISTSNLDRFINDLPIDDNIMSTVFSSLVTHNFLNNPNYEINYN